MTTLGRKRYIEYLAVLEQVLVDASTAVDPDAGLQERGGNQIVQ